MIKGDLAGPACTVRSQFYTPPSQFDGCFTTFYHLSLDVADHKTGGCKLPSGPRCGSRIESARQALGLAGCAEASAVATGQGAQSGATITDFLQPEWGNIRFFAGSLPSAAIGESRVDGVRFGATGPSSRPCWFELGTSRMWGIGFLPVGWARFIKGDAYDFANIVCHGASHPAFAKFDVMSDVLTDPAVPHEEQFAHIVEVMGSLMRPHRDEPKIARVHAALVDADCTAVSDLAFRAGMSIRTLERVCRRYFGFTPKLLMRRQRFMRSLSSFMLHQGSRWTEAMDESYHDQAQFTREFSEFMTMLPSEYASLEHPILASFMEARARVWGSAAQTLDRPDRCAEDPAQGDDS